jgi:hypothetical protein
MREERNINQNKRRIQMSDRNILAEIKDFFGMSASEFMAEWKELSPEDKADLKTGFENGSMTY